MPSAQLSLLCNEIERQQTDDFGKFYMYVSLLNTVAVQKKTFEESLPQYDKGVSFWKDTKLNVGNLSTQFPQHVKDYSNQFINRDPHWSKALYNIVLTYVRKGNVSDLIYIIDQMLKHLMAIDTNQSHNKKIHGYIAFDAKKAGLVKFIQQLSSFNKQLLSVVDNGGNAALSTGVVVVGLVLILASVFSLVPSLIGLGLMIGGIAAGGYFAKNVIDEIPEILNEFNNIQQSTSKLSQDRSFFGTDKNKNAFFSSALIPLSYAVVTGGEQLVFDENSKKMCSDGRQELDMRVQSLTV